LYIISIIIKQKQGGKKMNKKTKVIRTKTKYKNIYYNESTKKYDVKNNYKEYNPLTQKNEYKQKWAYNIPTIGEARQTLAELQTNKDQQGSKEITLEGAFLLWETKAKGVPYSPQTIYNTHRYMQVIYKYIPKETKLKSLTWQVYYKLISDLRAYGYAPETLASLNSTFRKIINLAYKNKLIDHNFLKDVDNVKTVEDCNRYIDPQNNEKIISKEDFLKLTGFYVMDRNAKRVYRNGVDLYDRNRLFLYFLYYTGCRVGELLALTYNDIVKFSYYEKGAEPFPLPSKDTGERLWGYQVVINKSYSTTFKIIKSPKNVKHRKIPLNVEAYRLYKLFRRNQESKGVSMDSRIFDFSNDAANAIISKACRACELAYCYSCHDFRHTFISNLISKRVPLSIISEYSGDTQTTILKRYSHMLESDVATFYNVINSL
jgi:integrase